MDTYKILVCVMFLWNLYILSLSFLKIEMYLKNITTLYKKGWNTI